MRKMLTERKTEEDAHTCIYTHIPTYTHKHVYVLRVVAIDHDIHQPAGVAKERVKVLGVGVVVGDAMLAVKGGLVCVKETDTVSTQTQ